MCEPMIIGKIPSNASTDSNWNSNFDILLKNFNIGHNFFTLRERTFIFSMFVTYDKAFSDGIINFEHVTFDLL